jgi:hypothetical protein
MSMTKARENIASDQYVAKSFAAGKKAVERLCNDKKLGKIPTGYTGRQLLVAKRRRCDICGRLGKREDGHACNPHDYKPDPAEYGPLTETFAFDKVRWLPDTRKTRQEIYKEGLIVLDEYDPTGALWQLQDIKPLSTELRRRDKWHPDPFMRDTLAEFDGGDGLWLLNLTEGAKTDLVRAVVNCAGHGLELLQAKARDRSDLLPLADEGAAHLEALEQSDSRETRLSAFKWFFALFCGNSGGLETLSMMAGLEPSPQDINRD